MESNETGTGMPTPFSYSDYCGNRLPCGVCRLTNSTCPIGSGYGQYPSPWVPVIYASSEMTIGQLTGESDEE